MTLHVTVGGGLVVGTPLGRRIATFAFLPFFPLLERFFCTSLGQSRLKWPEALQMWHWSLIDTAAITALRLEMGGVDDFLDRSSMWKLIAVCLICSWLKERSL